jgi:hypothetical protein
MGLLIFVDQAALSVVSLDVMGSGPTPGRSNTLSTGVAGG